MSYTYKSVSCPVSYTYIPGHPGRWNPLDGGDPPEGDEIEIIEVIYQGKNIVETLTDEEIDTLWDACVKDFWNKTN
jgi:hypothetical protein